MIKWWLTVGKASVQVSDSSDNDMVLTQSCDHSLKCISSGLSLSVLSIAVR